MTSAGGGHVSVDEVKEGGVSLSPGFVSIDEQRLKWWAGSLLSQGTSGNHINTGMVLRSNVE